MAESLAQLEGAPTVLGVEFRGRGTEYFRIWIVNVALSVITLGIYSAWAKVRTQRYFTGNTFLDGHSFEYHASAWRILVGRAIALTLFLGYSLSVVFVPVSAGLWLLVLAAALPWLANSSIRFNARNTSWRNVRFNFEASYFEAFIAYVVWSAAAIALFLLIPLTRRVHDYFYINHHRFGGRAFKTAFPAGRIYVIYLLGFVVIVALMVAVIAGSAGLVVLATRAHDVLGRFSIPIGRQNFMLLFFALFGLGAAFVSSFVTTLVTNLSIGRTTLEGGFRLSSRASGLRVAWIVVTNALLIVLTAGLYYPFARIRLARYRMRKYALVVTGDLDGFTAEALGAQSAIGEEIAGFFDFGFGL
ncbi:MAG TPA: YjgN family protein [Rhizomicrobium sp.]